MAAEATVVSQQQLEVRTDADIVRVRQAVRGVATDAGFSLVDQTKIVTGVSELARNTVIYGGGGTASIEVLAEGIRRGVRVRFVDEGPGIADVDQALTDGYTSGTGLGLGLSGTRRLVDEFVLDTEPGRGTSVCVVKWTR